MPQVVVVTRVDGSRGRSGLHRLRFRVASVVVIVEAEGDTVEVGVVATDFMALAHCVDGRYGRVCERGVESEFGAVASQHQLSWCDCVVHRI